MAEAFEKNCAEQMYELIRKRVSLRTYAPEMIREEDLDRILEAAMQAPTAGKQMLYSIIVIRNQEMKEKLAESCDHQPFIAKAPVLLLFVADHSKWFEYYRINDVPAFADREEGLCWEEPQESDLFLAMEDTMAAAENAVLMAEALGIGSCYIGDILERYEYHRELLSLPKGTAPIALLTLGYYPEGYKRVHRKRYDRKYVVFEERYHQLTPEELMDMYAADAATFHKTSQTHADNYAQAFYKRKTGAAFSKEMARSVRAILKDWQGGRETDAGTIPEEKDL